MKILNVFDAVRDGTFEDFKYFYNGQVNEVDQSLDINLLCMAVVNDNNPTDKLKIINFLLSNGIDVNYTTQKEKRNALHLLYFCNFKPNIEYVLSVTELLIDYHININKKDRYDAIPLKYAITVNKLPTYDFWNIYNLLIKQGSKYNEKDIFGKSCVDYAREFPWRNDLLDIMRKENNENNENK